jgi:HEAT repeat protein
VTDLRAERDALLVSLEREQRPSVRAELAESLCDVAYETPAAERVEFAPVVVRLLADQQAEVRCAGLAMSAEILPAGEAMEILVRHLADPTPRVRVEATGRLADLALPDSRGALAAALEDASGNVRFEAARGMAALQHSSGLQVLSDALGDPELRFRAAAALAQLKNREAVPALKKAFGAWFMPAFDRTQLAGALATFGEAEGLEHLFKRAGKRWSMDRAMALELLGEVKAPGAKARLLEVVSDAADQSRGAAARGLGRLGDTSVEPVLAALLSNEAKLADDVRLDVAEALLLLETPTARAVVERLHFDDPEARAELLTMLAETA